MPQKIKAKIIPEVRMYSCTQMMVKERPPPKIKMLKIVSQDICHTVRTVLEVTTRIETPPRFETPPYLVTTNLLSKRFRQKSLTPY